MFLKLTEIKFDPNKIVMESYNEKDNTRIISKRVHK